MSKKRYIMESDEEPLRLLLKTDPSIVKKQALWAGIKPGMRIADIGCGPGLTTSILHKLNQPNGKTVGIDFSNNRLDYAQQNYLQKGIDYVLRDARDPLHDLGKFDLIWVRFLLEYYSKESFEIVKNLTTVLKPGGTLCLIDLDYNCLTHFGIPKRLERTIADIMHELNIKANFDPFVGRKLYSFLYDLKFDDIIVDIGAHHNIYGKLNDNDRYNFLKKVEIAPQKINYKLTEYEGDYTDFIRECENCFENPRRFTYTPIILCKGTKPLG